MAATPKPEKNVNIDRFKLGAAEGEEAAAERSERAELDSAGGGGATRCAQMPPDVEPGDGACALPTAKAKVLLDDEEGDDEAAAAEAAYREIVVDRYCPAQCTESLSGDEQNLKMLRYSNNFADTISLPVTNSFCR